MAELKGKKFVIACAHLGKNAIGIKVPDNKFTIACIICDNPHIFVILKEISPNI